MCRLIVEKVDKFINEEVSGSKKETSTSFEKNCQHNLLSAQYIYIYGYLKVKGQMLRAHRCNAHTYNYVPIKVHARTSLFNILHTASRMV